MTNRIFRSMIGISVFVMLLCSIFLIGILHGHFTQQVMQELRSEARLISEGIRIGGNAYLTEIADGKNRVTLISTDGTVLFDTDGNIAEMENHLDRTEVQDAFSSGQGEASRISGTIGKKTLYYALRIEDGRILRIAAETRAVWALVLGIVHPLVIVLIITACLAAFLSQKLADRIIAPMNRMDLNTEMGELIISEEESHADRIIFRDATRQEIAELSAQMADFGVSLSDVADNCPKQERNKAICLRAMQYARENTDILDEFLRTRRLPLAKLSEGSRTVRKTLERHRKYLIALLLICTNGYEIIRGHLKQVLKGGVTV